MKEETKRYTLVEYLGPQVRIIDNYFKYQDLLDLLRKHNRRTTEKYYYGNVSAEKTVDGKYKVTVYVYNKLTKKMTISDIDNLTFNKDENSVIDMFKDKLKTNKIFTPDIQIMYFEEKNKKEKTIKDYDIRTKYIPVLYSAEMRFLDKQYIKKSIRYEARVDKDINFFKAIANEFCFYHVIADKIENLRHYINLCEIDENYFDDLEIAAVQLYEAFIKDRNPDKKVYRDENGECSYSRRRVRDFGFFVRDYMIPEDKRISPVKYNQTVSEKQMIKFRQEQLKKENERRKAEEQRRHEELQNEKANHLQLSLYDYLKD